MKVLGLDYGDASLGIAISDREQTLARGVENVRFKQGEDHHALQKVLTLLEQEPISAIVLGLPKNMDGSEGTQAEKTKAFKTLLETHTDHPVLLIDERLSSKMAKQTMVFGNKSRKKRRNTVDQMSAVLILQDYLDQQKNK